MSIELTAMVGTTLVDFRDYIDTLACESGPYYPVCARTGERPVPVATARFPDRKTAESASRAAEHYRRTLRRYDPAFSIAI